jgi:hypothetical protein
MVERIRAAGFPAAGIIGRTEAGTPSVRIV